MSMLQLISPDTVALLVLLAKATLLLVAAFGIAIVLQRAAAGARHLVWVGTLAAVLLLPAVAAWSPLRLAVLPAVFTAADASPVRLEAGAPPAPSTAGSPATRPVSGQDQRSTLGEATNKDISAVTTPARWVPNAWQLLLTIWGVVALALTAWLAVGFARVRGIVSRGTPLDERGWTSPLYEIADRLGIEQAPRIVRSEEVKMPFAGGLLAPTIVLPAECDGWDAERRSAVLMHELAHIRRRDLVGHTMGRVACAIYWFHPLVWSAARRLRIESERACDDLALTCGLRATSYAEHLLDIVSRIRQPLTPSAAIPMADRKEFEGRMLAILDPDVRRRAGRGQTLALIAGVAAMVVVVGGAVPASRSVNPSSPTQGNVSRQMQQSTFSDTFERQNVVTIEHSQESQSIAKRQSSLIAPAPSPLGAAAKSPVADAADKTSPEMKAASAALALRVQGRDADERPALLMQVLRTDSSATLRQVAAWGLEQYAERQDVATALADALKKDSSAPVREMAAWALANGRSASTVTAALIEALQHDTSADVRESAAWAIGSLEADGADAALTAALSDASPGVRSVALWALGNTGEGKAPAQVLDALTDKDARVREMAAWVLYSREDAAGAPALERALGRETEKSLRIAYIRALGAIGEASAPALARLLDSKDPDLRATVVNALAGRGTGPWPMPMPRPRPYP